MPDTVVITGGNGTVVVPSEEVRVVTVGVVGPEGPPGPQGPAGTTPDLTPYARKDQSNTFTEVNTFSEVITVTGVNGTDTDVPGGTAGNAADVVITTGTGGNATDPGSGFGGNAGNFNVILGDGGTGATTAGVIGSFRIINLANEDVLKITADGFVSGTATENIAIVTNPNVWGDTQTFTASSPNVPVVVRTYPGQTAGQDLTQWRDNSGNLLTKVDSAGRFALGTNTGFTGSQLKLVGYANSNGTDSAIEIGSGDGASYWRMARTSGGNFRMDLSAALFIMGSSVGINSTSPGAMLQVNTINTSTKGVIIKASSSQTANLMEVQDSTGTAVVTLDKDGIYKFQKPGTGDTIWVGGNGAGYGSIGFNQSGVTYAPNIFGNNSSLCFNGGTSGLAFRIGNDFGAHGGIDFVGSGKVGINTSSPGASLQVSAFSSSTKGMIIKGAASQTANVLEVQNSTGTAYLTVGPKSTLDTNGDTGLLANLTVASGTPIDVAAFKLFVDVQGSTSSGVSAMHCQPYITAGSVGTLRALMVYPTFYGGNAIEAYGLLAQSACLGGVCGSLYNISISNPYVASGSITYNYGLYINSLTAGSYNYAIYAGRGLVRFNDLVQIDVPTSTTKGQVIKCAVGQSVDALQVQDSSSGVMFAIDKNGGVVFASMADSTAAINTAYYSTTQNKLVYKDSGGVVNNLY
jgi:hypothetical protein